jgi:hypothetical protein
MVHKAMHYSPNIIAETGIKISHFVAEIEAKALYEKISPTASAFPFHDLFSSSIMLFLQRSCPTSTFSTVVLSKPDSCVCFRTNIKPNLSHNKKGEEAENAGNEFDPDTSAVLIFSSLTTN